MENGNLIASAIGDWVVALREEAVWYVRDAHEADILVAFMLTHLFNNFRATSWTGQRWQ